MKIVLVGSIPKGDPARKEWVDWKDEYIEKILRTVGNVEFVHGDSISDSAGPKLVVGHDLAQIKSADICVVDARQKIGAGTAQEMVYAKYLRKPVISVIPKNSHHRKSHVMFNGHAVEDWIHPFLYLSSDYVANSIEQAAELIKKCEASPESINVKGMSIFDEAIEAFEGFKEKQ